MNNSIPSLIDELIALEPSLASKREDVTRLVKELMTMRMDTKWRPQFEKELLTKLRGHMHENAPNSSSFFSSFFMDSRYLFAGGGAVVGAFLVYALTSQPGTLTNGAPLPSGDAVAQEQAVETVEPRAFGDLQPSQADASISARPQSGGGGPGLGGGGISAAQVADMESMANMGGDAKMATDMMIMPYEYTQVRYVYDGEVTLPTEDVKVFRRTPQSSTIPAGNAIGGSVAGLIDWDAFGSLSVQNVSVKESRKGGYSIYIDYVNGSLSINKEYDPNSNPAYRCQSTECYDQYRLKESDMLPDAEVIRIAREFAERMGIDLSVYGEPVVTDNWNMMYARAEDKAMFWFPEQQNVVFPLLLDGKPVYEEYGNPYGLSVSVDIRNKVASSLYNQMAQRFEQSSYAPVTDEAKLRAVIEQGSLYMWRDPNAKQVDAQLEAPTSVYMHTYKWDMETQTSEDLFVEALAFPIVEMPSESYETRTHVIVPLADEMLTQNKDMPVPMPMPMPIEDGAATELR